MTKPKRITGMVDHEAMQCLHLHPKDRQRRLKNYRNCFNNQSLAKKNRRRKIARLMRKSEYVATPGNHAHDRRKYYYASVTPPHTVQEPVDG